MSSHLRHRIWQMSRDWWAVLIAAVVAALVKLGVIGGVPW
jgi:hypothetical protein